VDVDDEFSDGGWIGCDSGPRATPTAPAITNVTPFDVTSLSNRATAASRDVLTQILPQVCTFTLEGCRRSVTSGLSPQACLVVRFWPVILDCPCCATASRQTPTDERMRKLHTQASWKFTVRRSLV